MVFRGVPCGIAESLIESLSIVFAALVVLLPRGYKSPLTERTQLGLQIQMTSKDTCMSICIQPNNQALLYVQDHNVLQSPASSFLHDSESIYSKRNIRYQEPTMSSELTSRLGSSSVINIQDRYLVIAIEILSPSSIAISCADVSPFVYIYHLDSGRAIHCSGHSKGVWALSSLEGLLVSGGVDTNINLCNTTTGSALQLMI